MTSLKNLSTSSKFERLNAILFSVLLLTGLFKQSPIFSIDILFSGLILVLISLINIYYGRIKLLSVNFIDYTVASFVLYIFIQHLFQDNPNYLSYQWQSFIVAGYAYGLTRFLKSTLSTLYFSISSTVLFSSILLLFIFQNYMTIADFGVLGEKNNVVVIAFIFTATLLHIHFPKTVWKYLIYAVSLIYFIYAKSRSGILCLGIFAVLPLLFQQKKWLKYSLSISGGLALMVAFFYFKPASILGRFHLWSYSLNNIDASFFWGAGLEKYGHIYNQSIINQFNNGQYQEAIFNQIGEVNHLVFNDFLQVYFELGIVGLLLFFMVIFSIFFTKSQLTNSSKLIICLALTIPLFFQYPLEMHKTLVLLFLLLGIVGNQAKQLDATISQRNLLFLLAPIMLGLMLVYKLHFEQLWSNANQSFQAQKITKAATYYQKAAAGLKNQPDFLYNSGRFHKNQQNAQNALKYFKRAEQLDLDYTLLLNLADLYEQTNQPQKALRYYEYADAIRPFTFYPDYRKFLIYYQSQDLSMYQSLGTEILTKEVRVLSPTIEKIKEDVQGKLRQNN